MFAADFDYHKATTVAEAIQLLGAHQDAKLLAGGHSLIPLMKLRLTRPSALIDIGGIADLKSISVTNNSLRIGALVTHGTVASSPEVQQANPLVAEMAAGIGDPQVRNWGTVGGNIVHADPSSDWGTVLTAMEASIEIQGPSGTRTAAVGDFFQGAFETTIGDDEIVTGVVVPTLVGHVHEADHGHGHGHDHDDHGHGHGHGQVEIHGQVGEYAKMSHPASFYAVVGGAVVVTVQDNRCTAAKIAVGGLIPSPVRSPSVENALVGKELTQENVTAAANHLPDDLGDNIIGDLFASADFRKAMAPIEVKHALFHAIGLAHH